MLNILRIPAKRGRRGHPEIIITSYQREKDFLIFGECGDYTFQEVHENERKGISKVLEQINETLIK